jgi:hypothetical protein
MWVSFSHIPLSLDILYLVQRRLFFALLPCYAIVRFSFLPSRPSLCSPPVKILRGALLIIGAASKQLPFLVDELRNYMWLARNIKCSWQRQLNKTTLFPPVIFLVPILALKLTLFLTLALNEFINTSHLHSLLTITKGTLPSHSLCHSLSHSLCHSLSHSLAFTFIRLPSFALLIPFFLRFFSTVTTLIPLP